MSARPTRLLLPALVPALVAACGLTACGSDEPNAVGATGRVLTVVSSDWNGWDPGHRPTPETTTVPVRVGAVATAEGVTFEVTQVLGSRVEVSSDQRLAPEGDGGGTDLGDLGDRFTVAVGEETRLDTPTLDGGTSYTLTLSP